ncbi:MAG: nucleoside deaminase [Solitalea-like symbiont of Acarus siro]
MDLSIDTYFMREALKEAQEAFFKNEVPIGAIICINNKIIARAHNMTERLNDATAHAEIQAITSASNFIKSKYLYECTLYTNLEPCIMCAGALFWSKIGRIVFGASDAVNGFTYRLDSYTHPRTIITSNVLASESKHIIDIFFHKKRKSNYQV